MKILNNKNIKNVAIIGIGYVGLPLAIAFHKHFHVTCYDFSKNRIEQLQNNYDKNKENNLEKINNSKIFFSNYEKDLSNKDVYIICVPTPILNNKKPDLSMLKNASKIVAKRIKVNSVIIYESTVYPGLTEEVCIPIITKYSNLKFNKNFFVGYSPERINPSDKLHNISNTIKIVSGSNKKTLNIIDSLYKKICLAGTYRAKNIKEAEGSKIIENIQRDLNIALMNELSIIFNKLNVNFSNVLKASKTKWNFANFNPGLVGGHCIGIDPYYLTYKSKKINYSPKIILAGRNINDNMHRNLFFRIKKICNEKKMILKKSKVLILGATFKENCTDFRNSRVIKFYDFVKDKFFKVDIYDPIIDPLDFKISTGIKLKNNFYNLKYDIIIFTVNHDFFINKKVNFYKKFLNNKHFVFSIKKTSIKFKEEFSL